MASAPQPFLGQLLRELHSRRVGNSHRAKRGVPRGEPAPPPVMKHSIFRGVQWSLKLQAWRVMLWHDGHVRLCMHFACMDHMCINMHTSARTWTHSWQMLAHARCARACTLTHAGMYASSADRQRFMYGADPQAGRL